MATFKCQSSLVPTTTIRLRGVIYTVETFRITTYPLTVGQFAAFCQSTGYITTAARRGAKYTYRNVPLYEKVEAEQGIPILDQSAHMLSFDDAEAFAAWVGWSVPYELQWLAAAVVDWDIVWEDVAVGYRAVMDRGYIRWHGYDFTATLADEARPERDIQIVRGVVTPPQSLARNSTDITVRCGPVYCLTRGWESKKFSFRCPKDYYSDFISVRLVRSEGHDPSCEWDGMMKGGKTKVSGTYSRTAKRERGSGDAPGGPPHPPGRVAQPHVPARRPSAHGHGYVPVPPGGDVSWPTAQPASDLPPGSDPCRAPLDRKDRQFPCLRRGNTRTIVVFT